MSQGLDALHHPRIKSAQVDISVEGKLGIGYMSFGDTKQYAAIENELKEYEYWSNLVKCYGDVKTEDLQRFIHNGWVYDQSGYKKDKALEIIKNKDVNVFLFKECCVNKWKMPYSYNQSFNKRKQLTEEEYDILREVLL